MKIGCYVKALKDLHSFCSIIEREPDELKPLYYHYYHKIMINYLVKGFFFRELTIKFPIHSVDAEAFPHLQIIEEIIEWIDFTILKRVRKSFYFKIVISSTPN